jgi:hypothetical protein
MSNHLDPLQIIDTIYTTYIRRMTANALEKLRKPRALPVLRVRVDDRGGWHNII